MLIFRALCMLWLSVCGAFVLAAEPDDRVADPAPNAEILDAAPNPVQLTVLPLRQTELGGARYVVASDSSYALAINGDSVSVLDLHSGMLLRTLATDAADKDLQLALHEARQAICVGGSAGVIRCVDVRNGTLLEQFRAPAASVTADWSSAVDDAEDAPVNPIYRLQALPNGRMLVVAGFYEDDPAYALLHFDEAEGVWRRDLELSGLSGAISGGLAVINPDANRLWMMGPGPDDASLLRLLELPSGKVLGERVLEADPGEPDALLLDAAHGRLALDYATSECVHLIDNITLQGAWSSCTDVDSPYLQASRALLLRAHLHSPAWLGGRSSPLLGLASADNAQLAQRLSEHLADDGSLFDATDIAVLDNSLDNLMIWTPDGVQVRATSTLRLVTSVQSPAVFALAADASGTAITLAEMPWFGMVRQRSQPDTTMPRTFLQRISAQPQISDSRRPQRLDNAEWVVQEVATNWALMHQLETPNKALLNLDSEQLLPLAQSKDLLLQHLDPVAPSVLLSGSSAGKDVLQWQRLHDSKLQADLTLDALSLQQRISARSCGDWMAYTSADTITLHHISQSAPLFSLDPATIESLTAQAIHSGMGVKFGKSLLFDASCERLMVSAHWKPDRYSDASGVLVVSLDPLQPPALRLLPVAEPDRVAPPVIALSGGLLAAVTKRGSALILLDITSGDVRSSRDPMVGGVAAIQPAGISGKFWVREGKPGQVSAHQSTWRLLEPVGLQAVATMMAFPGGCWLFLHTAGLYDSNCPGDVASAAWIAASEPMRAYPISAFARDYFEPGLIRQVLDDQPLRKVKAIADLDRRVPAARIVSAQKSATAAPGTAQIDLEVAVEGRVAAASLELQVRRNGHQIRLLRATELTWQYTDGESSTHIKGLALPGGGAQSEFKVSLFNADGIRGNGAPLLVPTPHPEVAKRAFVVAIGAQTFTDPRWNLSYAEADARAIVQGVRGRLPGYEVIAIDVAALGAVDKPFLKALFGHLAGKQARQPALRTIPIVRPEDTVIITYSGHGLATADGSFYLYPRNIGSRLDLPLQAAAANRLIEAGELADWVTPIDSENLLLIIDACQAAASILGDGRFRPLPARTRGLGYMAYNKGMRVLVASAANAVALESSRVEHGLLTYALMVEGLAAARADTMPADGKVSGSEWLRYARDRVPQLALEVQSGARIGRRGLRVAPAEPAAVAPATKPAAASASAEPVRQVPQLFDFRPPAAREFSLDVSRVEPVGAPVPSAE